MAWCASGVFPRLESPSRPSVQPLSPPSPLNHPDPAAAAAWFCQNLDMTVARKFGPPQHGHFLADARGTMMLEFYFNADVAVHVLATVVDKPEPGLALIDAGSKTFSSDRTADNIFALAADGRDLAVLRVNEEHGYVRGAAVDALRVGERIAFIPAHICPVINLTDEVTVTDAGKIVDTWQVEARGQTR